MKRFFFLGLIVLIFGLPALSLAQAESPNIRLSNEYIRIVVNASPFNTGRFSVGTTGGDPDRVEDQNKHLIYGGDEPWTSFTTLRVGNENWVFGSPTNRRAGREGLYGELIRPPTIVSGAIETTWKMGVIEVTQILGFARSSTTGLMDTARIEYRVHNSSAETQLVGLRLMLDTMLGQNDGAPFRVNDQALTSDTVFYSYQMPEFWQAFDSLSNPQVMAQGTLKGSEVTAPDRVYFTNWGSLADDLWNFDFQPGRDFTRRGEFDLDSAIAMFWDSKPLMGGETRSIVAHYGLGGVTIAPGDLSLGVTSPARVTADETHRQSFPIIAYIQNTGRGEARGVRATIELPPGLQLLEGTKEKIVGNLDVGETFQTSWQVIPSGEVSGSLRYQVHVFSENSESNRVYRDISIVSPARIQEEIRGPFALSIVSERLSPSPIEVTAILRNVGGIEAHQVSLTMDLPIGLGLAKGERKTKYPGNIEPGEEIRVKWHLEPLGVSGNLPYTLRITSSAGMQVRNNFMIIPALEPKLFFTEPSTYGRAGGIQQGEYFSLSVMATNFKDFVSASLDLDFDPEYLEIVGHTLDIGMGALFMGQEKVKWTMPHVSNVAGWVKGIQGEFTEGASIYAFGTLVTVHFRTKKAGTTEVRMENVEITTTSGVLGPATFRQHHREITILP